MAFFTRRGNASVPEIPNVAVGQSNNNNNNSNSTRDRDGVEV